MSFVVKTRKGESLVGSV